MKWATAISFLTAGVLATPVPAPDAEALVLKVLAPGQEFDGKTLSVLNGKIGLFEDQAATTLEVFAVPGARSDQVVLHTYPIGIQDTVVAIVGDNDLYNLATLQDPVLQGLRPNSTVDWSFTMAMRGDRERNEPENSLRYLSKPGSWVVFPHVSGKGEFVVKFRGSEAWTTQDYQPIKIIYQPIV